MVGRERKWVFILVFVSIVSVAMGQSVVFAILAPLGREVGLVELQIGIIVSCSAIVYSFVTPIWGRKSDVLGRKPVIVIGLLGYTFGTLLFVLPFYAGLQGWLTGMALFSVCVLTRMAQSVVMSGTAPAATAYIADITEYSRRTAGMGSIGAAHSLGLILGPAIGVFAFISLLAPLYIVAGLTLLVAFAVILWLPGLEPRAVPGERDRERMSYFDKRIFSYIATGMAIYTGISMVHQTLGYVLQDRLTLTAQVTAQKVGIIMMAAALTALFSQVVVVQIWKWQPRRLLRVGLPVMLVGFVGMGFVQGFYHILVFMLFVGLGMGMAGPGYVAAATLSVTAEEQGAVAGLISACPALGYIVGPVLGGGLYQLNPHLPFIVTCVLFVPLVWFVWVLNKGELRD